MQQRLAHGGEPAEVRPIERRQTTGRHLAEALRLGEHHQELLVPGVAGGGQRNAAVVPQRAVHVVLAVDEDRWHPHRHGRGRSHHLHQLRHRGGVVLGPEQRLAVGAPERPDPRGGAAGREGVEVERQDLVRQTGLLVDVLGVEQPLAPGEAAPVAEVGVPGELHEALARPHRVPRQVVGQVCGARRDARHEPGVDLGLDERLHHAGGVHSTHAATLEEQGDLRRGGRQVAVTTDARFDFSHPPRLRAVALSSPQAGADPRYRGEPSVSVDS